MVNVVLTADGVWRKVWFLLPDKVFCLKDLEGKVSGSLNLLRHYMNVLVAAGWLEVVKSPECEVYVHGRHKFYWKKKVEVAQVKPVPEPVMIRSVPEENKEVDENGFK